MAAASLELVVDTSQVTEIIHFLLAHRDTLEDHDELIRELQEMVVAGRAFVVLRSKTGVVVEPSYALMRVMAKITNAEQQ